MRLLLLLATLLPALASAGQKPILAVLDFECPDDPELGTRFATRLNTRLLQANNHVLFDRYDLTMAIKDAGLKPTLKGNEKAIQAFAHDTLGANLVMWGKVERKDSGFHVAIRCMKTEGEPTPYLDVAREVPNFAFFTKFYKEFEPILLEQRTTLRKLHPVAEEAKARNLIANPSFEKGTWYPAHWTKTDGLTSFWIARKDGKGKCLMCDTDVNRKQGIDWMEKVRAGKATAKDAPKPIRSTPGTIYDTVGGWEGVQIYSDIIPAKPKMRYRLTVDIKAKWGGIFFPKAFIKGYADQTDEFTSQKREHYRAYLALRTKTQGREWETFTRTFNPSLENPKVKYMRVMLYSYWPLGTYYWDNIVLTEEAIED